MNDITLFNQNGRILASSRDVAEKFGKAHKDVLDSIRNLTAENSAVKSEHIDISNIFDDDKMVM